MSEIEKLKKQLAKIEAALDKCRGTVQEDGWQTMRYAKKMRKWDYYAQEKMKLINQIEDYENSICINEKV